MPISDSIANFIIHHQMSANATQRGSCLALKLVALVQCRRLRLTSAQTLLRLLPRVKTQRSFFPYAAASKATRWEEVFGFLLTTIIVLVVVVVAGAYTGFLLSLELASLLECRRGPVHTLGKATAGE